jgi:hypothetical protein
VAGSPSRTRSSWARELISSLVNTLPRWYLTRARADEQPGADLRVRQPIARQPGDLHLLRGELIARLDSALARRLAGGLQLVPGPLGEGLHAHQAVQLMSDAQLLAGVQAPTLAAQPFTVERMGAGERHTNAGAAEPLDRLEVEVFGRLAVAQQCSRTRLDPQRPVRAGGAADLLEPPEGPGSSLGPPRRNGTSTTPPSTAALNRSTTPITSRS